MTATAAEATGFLQEIKGFGGYTTTATLIVFGLLTWWKVLPTLIDAMTNRQSKIEERMGKLLEDATARFTREIEAADKRHDDCMAGQDKLLGRIDVLERKVGEQQQCIDEQQVTIEGLRRKDLQQQVSALRTEGNEPSPMIAAAIARLSTLPEVKR